MAGIAALKNIRRAYVIYEDDDTVSGGNRWFDAIGPGVSKYVTEFTSLPFDNATTDPIDFTLNITEGGGASTTVMADYPGGALIITADDDEDDGVQMQLGPANTGEWVSLDPISYTYFGIEFAGNDVDQSDFLFGIAVTDTDCLGGVTDGLYFRSPDQTGVLSFVLEKNSLEAVTAVATLADDAYIEAEFFVDGPAGYVHAYINGALVASISTSDVRFPNDEDMRLTLEFLTGEDVANYCTITHVRLIHIR
jgi:hypothetical protein